MERADLSSERMKKQHKYHKYRRIHHVKFLAFHGNQLEYNGSQGANGAVKLEEFDLKGMKSTED